MRNKIIVFFSLITTVLIINSCCDCPLEPTTNPKCSPLEATITKFEPGRIKDSDTTSIPVDSFSIHSFAFPTDYISSGSLPNDERFRNSSTILINKVRISTNPNYYLAYYNSYPLNSDQNGDILLKSVDYNAADISNSTAIIRVKGYLNRLTSQGNVLLNFTSDNAQTFCEFIENNKDNISNSLENAKEFGAGIPGSNIFTYDPSSFVVIDDNNTIISTYKPSQDAINDFFDGLNEKSVDIQVKMGDVFVYQTTKGSSFVFAVVNINNGFYEPYKKRLTIMFSRI